MNSNQLLLDAKTIILNYNKYDSEDVKILWHHDYYDGPLSGMAEFNGKRAWFIYIDDIKCTNPTDDSSCSEATGPATIRVSCSMHGRKSARAFALFELTTEQQRTEDYWHSLFEMCVGTHTNYCDGARVGVVHDSEFMKKFFSGRYKKDYKELDLNKATLIGWFVE